MAAKLHSTSAGIMSHDHTDPGTDGASTCTGCIATIISKVESGYWNDFAAYFAYTFHAYILGIDLHIFTFFLHICEYFYIRMPKSASRFPLLMKR